MNAIWDIRYGDCRTIMQGLAARNVKFDACITDPPYGLEFMGKEWDRFADKPRRVVGTGSREAPFAHHAKKINVARDRDYQAWTREWTCNVYDVLKPGAHLAVFGGTRTFHRVACAIEDAGFEIRDTLCWLYGSGFPKSLNVSKVIDEAAGHEQVAINEYGIRETIGPITPEAAQWAGWGTALKPAWEPIILARKPLIGTVAANVLAHGTGALNVDECRIGTDESTMRPVGKPLNGGAYASDRSTRESLDRVGGSVAGRWPANVLHDGSAEVETAFAEFGDKLGFSGGGRREGLIGKAGAVAPLVSLYRGQDNSGVPYGDIGSASRFFYTAKADSADRVGSKHPTIKPVALMYWLARLITPPNGKIIDPFAGSGTTLQAAVGAGFNVLGCELEAEYVADIERRMQTLCPWFDRKDCTRRRMPLPR